MITDKSISTYYKSVTLTVKNSNYLFVISDYHITACYIFDKYLLIFNT